MLITSFPRKEHGWITEDLIQEARQFLEQEDEAINKQLDANTGTYYSICISFLKKKYKDTNEKDIKLLYDACMNKTPEKVEKISYKTPEKVEVLLYNTPEKVEKILYNTPEKVPANDIISKLTDQLSFTYKEYCLRNNINEKDPLPEDKKNEIIFEYSWNGEAKKTISLYMARFLLTHNSCRSYFSGYFRR